MQGLKQHDRLSQPHHRIGSDGVCAETLPGFG